MTAQRVNAWRRCFASMAATNPRHTIINCFTALVDQTNPDSFDQLSADIPGFLDLIIDDGLHSTDANLATLLFALAKLRPGGLQLAAR